MDALGHLVGGFFVVYKNDPNCHYLIELDHPSEQ